MGWFEKVVGGAIGFAITGGPVGAILGAIVGGAVGEGRRAVSTAPRLTRAESRQSLFFVTTFSMLGKLARADGQVSPPEIEVIETFMRDELRLEPRAREFAISIFRQAKESPHGFNAFAEQFANSFANEPEMKEMLIDLLLRVSVADGKVHQREDQMMASAAHIFGFARADYQRLRRRLIPDLSPDYQLLGCRPSDSDEQIRKRYRELAKEFHPDRIIARGLPEEFAEVAKRKFQELQSAYDKIAADRGIK